MARDNGCVRNLTDAVTTRKMSRKKNGRLKHGHDYAFRINHNGTPVLLTRSGQRVDLRTVAGRTFLNLITGLVDDLGGPDNITTAELQLIRRAAALSVDLSFQEADAIDAKGRQTGRLDPQIYTSMATTQRQILQALGLRRRSRNITPPRLSFIEGRAEEVGDDD